MSASTSAPPVSLARLGDEALVDRSEFPGARGFLDSATYGLPCAATVAALAEGLAAWQAGTATAASYDTAVTAARAAFASMAGVTPADVAVGNQASVFVGMVAASLPAGSEVVVADCEFTSVIFPFLARAGLAVRLVPLDELAASVRETTRLVVVSSVQSCDGRIADLAGIRAAATAYGARVLLDVTQSAGWLPLQADDYDYVVCSAYKWLLCPRGAGFFTVRPDAVDSLVPINAGWYAGEDPWTSVYGGPLRLAADARRFDISPAWLCWLGAVPALTLLNRVGVDRVHRHNVALADRFRAGVGLPPGDSAVVKLCGIPDATERLARAGVRASARAGGLRVAFHLYNDAADVDRALDALA